MTHTELLKLKQQIESAEKQAAQLEGQQQYLLQRLLDEFGCKSVEAAEKKLDELDDEIVRKGKELAQALSSIEEKYNNS